MAAGQTGGNTIENVPTPLLLRELDDLQKDFLFMNIDTSEVLAMYKSTIEIRTLNFI